MTWGGSRPGAAAGKAGSRRRFCLVRGGESIPLPPGEFLIGRSSRCHVVVRDMSVSRRHARLHISSVAVFVEDLGSANGLFVNEMPIEGAQLLNEGDRLLVGKEEFKLGVVEQPEPDERGRAIARIARQPTAASEVSSDKAQSHPGFDSEEDSEPTELTQKQDNIVTFVRLADRMIALGRNQSAIDLVGDHLCDLRVRVDNRDVFDPRVLEASAVCALRIAEATAQVRWARLALELFSVPELPMSERCLRQLVLCVERGVLDAQAVRDYQAKLKSRYSAMTAADQKVAEKILRLQI